MRTEPYYISFVRLGREFKVIPHPGHFAFNPRRRFKWLQHLALWVLEKLDCGAYNDVETVTRHLVDPDKFMQKVIEQRKGLMQECREPKSLLVGGEDYRKLLAEPGMRSELVNTPFSFLVRHRQGGRCEAHKVMGLTVHVVPWMRGILVLPWGLTGKGL